MTQQSTTSCQAGYYCPDGTSTVNQYPCPAGTYSDSVSLTGVAECTDTEAGYTSPQASTASDKVDCNNGYYCPLKTPSGSDIACPAGRYSNTRGLTQASECTNCPAGSYCLSGTTAITGACAAGFYCPSESYLANTNPCPTGSFSPSTSLTAANECSPATAGNHVPATGSSEQTPCPPGTFSGAGSATGCDVCPAGSKCVEGTSAPVDCGIGFYSDDGASACIICPKGKYCGVENDGLLSGTCFAGVLCPEGMSRTPALVTEACPTGHYCPVGATEALPCPTGTYNDLTGQAAASDCTDTPAGSYSTQGASAISGACSPGFYCPINSSGPFQVACIPGTYRAETSGTAVGDCGDCPAGSYCPAATFSPLLCPRGYYCPTGTAEPSACLPGTYGYYCDTYAMQGPKGMCAAGYFCIAGLDTMTPASAICPAGNYCPMGSPVPTPCPAGTFRQDAQGEKAQPGYYAEAGDKVESACQTGKFQIDAGQGSCDDCPAGSYCPNPAMTTYCDDTGLTEPTGDCDAGYYCTIGATAAEQATITATGGPCQPGMYCLAGSGAPSPFVGTPCPIGTYFSGTANTECAYLYGICPVGNKCVTGAIIPVACPEGTFQDTEGNADCTDCTNGYYCPDTGMNDPSVNDCPAGSYCPTGSINPTPCSAGRFSTALNLIADSDCTECTPGFYCATAGLTEPTGVCSAGSYCTLGATTAVQSNVTSTGGPCPSGEYCLENSVVGTPCPIGTYMTGTANDGCTPCATGPACLTSTCPFMFGICPISYKCPVGIGAPVICPEGTFQDTEGNADCTDCTNGYYCPDTGMNDPSVNDCPAGSYCPTGSINPTPCSAGRFSTALNLIADSDCTECTPGFYCATAGLTEPTGVCSAGSYCTLGATTAVQNDCTDLYGICPIGHKCELGFNVQPVKCPAGTFQAEMGQDHCDACPAGFYCDGNGGQPVICPAGSYCPISTRYYNEFTCEIGTYSTQTGLDEQDDCVNCLEGHFCPTPGVGAAEADSECSPGYYCKGGSESATPVNDTVAGVLMNDLCGAGKYCPSGTNFDESPSATCPPGSFCVAGSKDHELCPGGSYQAQAGQSDCEPCQQGYYCPTGATIEIVCPAGRWCAAGVSIGTPCDVGYYTTSTGLTQSTECTECPESRFCNGGHLLGTCAEGYFCKGRSGSQTPTTNAQCPPGYYCPQGTIAPIMCPNGTVYESTTAYQESQCGDCPAGTKCIPGNPCSVCPAGYSCADIGIPDPNYNQYPCPLGHYCPGGGVDPIGCPGGTYLPTTGSTTSSSCIICDQYKYCPEGSEVQLNCPAGMYCSVNSESGIYCPPGTYCPEFSLAPVDCPSSYYCQGATNQALPCYTGTYCPANTANAIMCALETACEACPAGMYGADGARLVCTEGTPGYVFYGGTTGPTPLDVATENGEICPVGHYCPASSASPLPCPAGYYQPDTGASSLDSCLSCEANSYQFAVGSATCLVCSSSASSDTGATECQCVGNNRSFQPEDGRCICNPGYEFVDAEFKTSSENDGAFDCQPVVYSRCGSDETRNSAGKCVDTATYCYTSCGGSGGTVSSSTGICECNIVTPLEQICNQACRDAAPVVSCTPSGDISVYDPSTGLTDTMDATTYTASAGKIDCSVANSKIVTMDTTSGSFEGVFGAASSIVNQVQRDMEKSAVMEIHNRRQLQGGDPEISNPVVCLNVGDSIVFEITEETYPQYVKDSLLNTNDLFDYSAFRNLAVLAETSQLSLSSFVFTFSAAGTYVFQLSSASESLTIMSILGNSMSCGTAASFVEMNSGTLITLGVKSSSDLVLGPDWPLVIGLVLGMAVLVLLVVHKYLDAQLQDDLDLIENDFFSQAKSLEENNDGRLKKKENMKKQKTVLVTDYEEKQKEITKEYGYRKKIADEGLLARHKKEKDDLKNRLRQKKEKRFKELVDGGMSESAAKKQVISEVKPLEIEGIEAADRRSESARADLTNGLKDMVGELGHKIDISLEAAKDEINEDENLSDADKKKALTKLDEDYNADMQRLKDQEERAKQSKLLKERIARKKALRKKMLKQQGLDSDEIDKRIVTEFAEDVALLDEKAIADEVSEKINILLDSKRDAVVRISQEVNASLKIEAQKEDEAIISLMDKAIANSREVSDEQNKASRQKFNAIRDAAIANTDDTDEALNNLRKEHDSAVNKLQEDFKVKKMNQESALQKKLAARRAKRTEEVEQELKKENPEISGAKLAEKVEETVVREEKKSVAEMDLELKEEEEKEVNELEKRKNELEKKVIEREVAAMNTDRKSNDSKLKQRLADKRAKKMADMDAMNASASQRAAEEARLAEEEHQLGVEAKRKATEEEEARLQKLQELQKAAEEEAKKKAQEAEVEAAIAASKQAALDAVKQTRERAERELNQREATRMKEKLEQEAEKAVKEKEVNKNQKKMKLEDRLKAKREKKERDMADQESKKLAELASAQAKDAEEKERLKREKMIWSEHLAEAQEKALKAGLGIAETEDFCIKETIGKKEVSAEHMSECVERILAPRQSEETSQLMESNFKIRMDAIKDAVALVLSEKKDAMVRLMSRLEDEEASEDTRDNEKKALEEEFQKKQLESEKRATAALEQDSMKSQMTLHQHQLEEISKICMLHSDPETMAKLQESSGKSKVEEMADYRAKLQEEKEAREASMKKEREEAEAKMRSEMEKQMANMKAMLKAEADKAEAEYAKQKADMEKEMESRKKDMEAKKNDATKQGDQKEQERIKASFEKEAAAAMQELDADRTKKKSKLQERLAAKRKKDYGSKKKEKEPSAEQPADGTVAENGNATATNPETAMAALETKMDRIGAILEVLERRNNTAAASVAAVAPAATAATDSSAASSGPVLVKPAADEPAPGTTMKIVSDGDLHVQQRARLEFGYKVAELMGFKELTINGASSLPQSTAVNNAFCNSYAYDNFAKQLSIHVDRMSSSGDFGLVIIHALSHIKVNPKDLSNDADAAFTSEFYSNLKILSQDLYKHSTNSVAKQMATAGTPRNAGGNGEGVEKEKDYYSEDSLAERMKKYAQATGGQSIPLEYLERYSQNQEAA
eukprot:GSChrysophyteH2.ASY1.ANO1.1387.1 assembled CDS